MSGGGRGGPARRLAGTGPAARIAGAGALLAGLVASGCGEGPRSGGAEPADVPEAERYGGTAVVAGRRGVPTLNPLVSTTFEASQIQKHVLWTPLLRYDSAYAIRPHLAESWELAPDSTEITFRLRDDVRWHDGEPVTAEDVAFTFERVKDPDIPFPNRGWFDGWEEAEVVDARTIRFRLEPRAGFLAGWTQTAILPEHVLGEVAVESLPNHPFGNRSPVGSGPFRFVEWSPDRVVFEANPDFPAGLGGRPYLDRLVYRVVPDPTALLSELATGGVHFYMEVPPSQLARARAREEIEVISYPSRTYAFIAWNTRRPWFSDPAVRRALTLALDRRQILEAARNGLGAVASGPLGPWHWARDPDDAPLPHDPDSARALLEAAGWTDADGDGVRERDGVPFRFDLATSEDRIRRDIAVIVQDQLSRVGVEARPTVREAGSLGAAVTGSERDFDAVILAWVQDRVLDDRDLWACGRRGQPFQFTGYCDPDLDAVMDSIVTPLPRETRARLYRRYDEIISRAQPYTFLYFETVADAYRRELRGVRLDARGELASVRGWWLLPGARGVADR